MKIPLNSIIDRRAVNRREEDPQHVQEIAEGFRLNGQLQPVRVRKANDGTYDLIAGGTRIAAAKLLGWTHIEAFSAPYHGKVELASMDENLTRKNLTPLEEADQVQWMNGPGNMSINEIAERTHHSREWVEKRLELATYTEDVKHAIHKKIIPLSAGRMMTEIDNAEYRQYLIHIAEVNGATVSQVETWWLDYTARKRMIETSPHPPSANLPPSPPKGYTNPCWLCAEVTPAENAAVVRVCLDCMEEVRQSRLNAIKDGDQPKPV